MAGVVDAKDQGDSSKPKDTNFVIECKGAKEWYKHINKKKATKSKDLVVVEFVSDWATDCKPFSPVVEQVARENPDVTFLQVNADRQKVTTEDDYKVGELPTLIFFKEGAVVDRIAGVDAKKGEGPDKEKELRNKIKLHM